MKRHLNPSDSWPSVGSWSWLLLFGILGVGTLLYQPADSASSATQLVSASPTKVALSDSFHVAAHGAHDGGKTVPASLSAKPSPQRLTYDTRNIENIRVGDRVLAANPEITATERAGWKEPEWASWLKLSLLMPKPDGSKLKIEMLRPEPWVIAQIGFVVDYSGANYVTAPANRPSDGQAVNESGTEQVPALVPLRPVYHYLNSQLARIEQADLEFVALSVEMDLPELGLTGDAILVDMQPAPAVKPGDGQVVTATFHHSSGDVIDLVLEDTDRHAAAPAFHPSSSSPPPSKETIGTTSNHPFWSVDRHEYVQAGTLEPGERVLTYSGDTKRVTTKLARPGPQSVYNLEVHGEHVYFVGNDGVLVHNSGRYADVDPGAPFGRKKDGSPKAQPGPKTDINGPQNAAVRAVIEEQTARGLKHIGGGRAAGVGDLAEIEIVTDGGLKATRRMDASFQDPVTGKIIHFQVGQKNLRGDPIIRERRALLDVIRFGKGFKSEYVIKFREFTP